MAQLKSLIVEGQTVFADKVFAETQPDNTDDDRLATTEFVNNAIYNALH